MRQFSPIRPVIAILLANLAVPCPSPAFSLEFTTTKICQLSGEEDRQTGQPTGIRLAGSGGLRATDLGVPFEHAGKLYFLFGDTLGYDPDLCEPALCGPNVQPVPQREGNPKRWPTRSAWDDWLRRGRDGADSIGTAPLDVDPDRCIPVTVQNDDGRLLAYDVTRGEVGTGFLMEE